ncbi:MAG: rRNA maturation RNase YbeY [Candidatus Ornithospirochaeta sp.]|nr:rRNA maturation RNase YbeY [Candidatus Ornithospirochaeta sp.]
MHYIEGIEDENRIEEILNSILGYLGEDGDFSLHFITDEEIRDLNREYRGMDNPTDILTFAINDGEEFPMPEEEKELGDVFISLDSMRRNAESFGVDEDEELKRLLVHGILHLEGYDHSSNDFASEPMLIRQEKIMKELGFLSH